MARKRKKLTEEERRERDEEMERLVKFRTLLQQREAELEARKPAQEP